MPLCDLQVPGWRRVNVRTNWGCESGLVQSECVPASVAALTIWYVTGTIDYSAPGRLTDLGEVSAAVLEPVPADPVGICRLVPGLVLHPFEAADLGLDADRLSGREIRSASAIIHAVLALSPSALDVPREPERRLVGTCRTFVVLSCALLRLRGPGRPWIRRAHG